MPILTHRLRLAIQVLLHGQAPVGNRREVPAITPAEVAEARAFFPLDKFFIFGHARSGTTLLTRLVRLHPMVHCNYQAHFFTRQPLLEAMVADEEIGRWLGRNSNRWNQGRDLSPLVLRASSDFIMERDARRAGKFSPGCIVGDKSPNSLLDGQAVRNLLKIYPDARLVFIVRDGRDAAISHRFQAFIDRPQHLNKQDLQIREDFIHDPSPFHARQRSLFTEKSLRQAAEGWVHNVEDTHQVACELMGERYLHLRYEDLLSDPVQEMQRIWGFLGADANAAGLSELIKSEMDQNPDADWQEQKAGDIASALHKGQRGTWRDLFTQEDRRIFLKTAANTLTSWGYAPE